MDDLKNTELYVVQIKGPNGWEFGPRLYGLDMTTGLVGSEAVGTQELAQQVVEDWRGDSVTPPMRIVKYVVDRITVATTRELGSPQ